MRTTTTPTHHLPSLLLFLLTTTTPTQSFTFLHHPSSSSLLLRTPPSPFITPTPPIIATTKSLLHAGGFEYEDPIENFDQGIENPFKNPDYDETKIEAGRLLAPRLQGSNLYLIGMMGSGKSTIANLVAKRMGTYNCLDTDTIIESATNLTIPEIFSQEGEEAFREIEAQVLDSVHAYVRCVVSTGGGIVCRLSNWSKLQTGIVIWLDVTPDVLIQRLKGTDRPLLQTEDPLQTLRKLLEERKGRYAQADVRIEISKEMRSEDVASKVIRELHDYIDENPPAWKMAKAKAQAEGLDWVQ